MRYRGLILLAFAVATFATLRFTMGPRHHRMGCERACHAATCGPSEHVHDGVPATDGRSEQ